MHHHIQFSKYHGLGNDFIVIDGLNQRLNDISFAECAAQLCDRHFGIGADGIILCLPSDHSDAKMVIYNSDGSNPETCGNGIRCFARFVFEKKLVEKDLLSIEITDRVVIPAIIQKNGQVAAIEVDMGTPDLHPASFLSKAIPDSNTATYSLNVDAQTQLEATVVSMGNPHAVIFVDDVKKIPISTWGPIIEQDPLFQHKTNVEFVQVLSKKEILVHVWERGAGETLACGTGACASVVAGVLHGHCDRNVAVHLPGGKLLIDWQAADNKIVMTGPATHIYDGTFTL